MNAIERLDAAESDDREDELARDFNAYEREYEEDHSWEELQEDEHGNLRLDRTREQRARRQQLLSTAASARIRRGLIRYVQLVIDLSRAAAMTDMRPNRAAVLLGVAQQFIRAFFDENPLSQLGIILLRNGVAQQLTELSSSPEAHLAKLRGGDLEAGGDASLQNAIDLAVGSLRSIPPYGHREVLMLYAALSTCDPGNIMDSIKAAKQQRVRISLVGLSAEVHICRVTAQDTGGTYTVATGEAHLEQLVRSHAVPPPTPPGSTGASLVKMGFPAKNSDLPGTAAFVGPDCELRPGGFTCPRCKARAAELPSKCHVCGLTLVSSPHLARSYHHLFPVKPFLEVEEGELANLEVCEIQRDEWEVQHGPGSRPLPYCYGCSEVLVDPPAPVQPAAQHAEQAQQAAVDGVDAEGGGIVVRCPDCACLFCFDCDAFIHEQLHNCPGCECLPPQGEEGDAEVAGGQGEAAAQEQC